MPTAVITGGAPTSPPENLAGAPTSPPEDAVNYYKSYVPADVLATLVGDERALAVDLYQAFRMASGNLFLSPYGLYAALSMVYAGASGQTAVQMARALHFTTPRDEFPLPAAVESLGLELEGRGLLFNKQSRQNILRLKAANSTWGQAGYPIAYKALGIPDLDKFYGAYLRPLDFAAAPDPSRQTIDAWAKDQTAGRIADLLSAGAVDKSTRLVLANGIQLGIPWKSPFAPSATKTAPFHLLDGSTVDVATMSATPTLPYVKGQGYQAVEIPYDGDGLGLTILLPDAGAFTQFEQGLTVAKLKDALAAMAPKQVALSLPKLKLEPRLDLVDPLKGMDVADAFDAGKADFTGMTDRRGLSIADVVHKATISLDEQEVEATAATGVVLGTTGARNAAVGATPTTSTQPTAVPQSEVTVAVDRPFFFLIRDAKTDAVVFLGRITNPIA